MVEETEGGPPMRILGTLIRREVNHDDDPYKWHVLDDTFIVMPEQPSGKPFKSQKSAAHRDDGLPVPKRNTGGNAKCEADVCRDATQGSTNTIRESPLQLRITNLDHSDPLGYQPGGMPRERRFIERNCKKPDPNVFLINKDGTMPEIRVVCSVKGFDPKYSPIYWRLQCCHVACRYLPVGRYRYSGMCRRFTMEWQGRCQEKEFTLFSSGDKKVEYLYNELTRKKVFGGHAILTVAARPWQGGSTLMDYVHLRIGGLSPGRQTVFQFIEKKMTGYNPNLVKVAKYLARHESGGRYRQFATGRQSGARFKVTPKRHGKTCTFTKKDHCLDFQWPADPPNSPYIAFDWGVGIMQYNQLRGRDVRDDMIWDWREAVVTCINEMLGSMRHRRPKDGETWKQWTPRSLMGYNVNYRTAFKVQYRSGKKKGQYVNQEYRELDDEEVPSNLKLAPIPLSQALPPAPAWPPTELEFSGAGDYPQPSGTEATG